MKQIYVSGATGFVGRHVVPKLVKHGYTVTVLGRHQNKVEEFSWSEDVSFVPLDLQTGLGPEHEVIDGSILIHLAWAGLPNYNSRHHLEENLPQSLRFIQDMVSRGVKHVFVGGTCFEFGQQFGPLTSAHEPKPVTVYARAKDELRKSLEDFHSDQDFVLQWGRMFYLYGPGQSSRSLLSQLDRAIDDGSSSFDMSSGEQIRDFLRIDAAADQIVELLTYHETGTFNICSGVPVSVRSFVEDHVRKRGASISLSLGIYPLPNYEPLAFWGVREVGETYLLPSLPNAPLADRDASNPVAPMRLRYQPTLHFLENQAFDERLIDYGSDYQNSQAYSNRFMQHMQDVLTHLKTFFPRNSLLIDVGCGMGAFVEMVQRDGYFRIKGFDASYQGENLAIEKRYLTSNDRIDADLVILRHVLEHVTKPFSFLSDLSKIFSSTPIYIEVPSLDWTLQNKAFFDITFEHVNYFSQRALQALFNDPQANHDLCFDDQYQFIIADLALLGSDFEEHYSSGDWHLPAFSDLFPNMGTTIDEIDHAAQGKQVYIWGAATKGCLFLAHCKARGKIVDKVTFAVDISPEKIGKYIPGTLIAIANPDEFMQSASVDDILVIVNPAYEEEIRSKLLGTQLENMVIYTL